MASRSGQPVERDFKSLYDLADFARNVVNARRVLEWPRLLIIGRSDTDIKYEAFFADTVRVAPGGVSFFWGRVPLDRLINFISKFRGWSADQLYVDLGSPLRLAGSNSSFDRDCSRLLALSAQGQAKVGAAIVDLGTAETGAAPDGLATC